MPVSMALTEWHFIMLYEDKIRVIGLLSDKVVYEEPLDLVSWSSWRLRSALTPPRSRTVTSHCDSRPTLFAGHAGCTPISPFLSS